VEIVLIKRVSQFGEDVPPPYRAKIYRVVAEYKIVFVEHLNGETPLRDMCTYDDIAETEDLAKQAALAEFHEKVESEECDSFDENLVESPKPKGRILRRYLIAGVLTLILFGLIVYYSPPL
jgi:hypothetical protein